MELQIEHHRGTATRDRARIRAFIAAVGIVATTGCAGVARERPRVALKLPDAPAERATTAGAPTPPTPPTLPTLPTLPAPVAPQLEERVHTHVASRMPKHPPALQRAVAESVIAEAKRARLDPSLVLAVIHVESSFRPRARSRAGAKGLMQIRTAAVREELRLCRAEAKRVDTYEPAMNIRIGVAYLRRLLERFDRLDLALVAYNAGPARTGRWVARERAIPAKLLRYPRKVQEELDRVRLALGVPPRPVREPEAIAAQVGDVSRGETVVATSAR